jgi:hypothetical protein
MNPGQVEALIAQQKNELDFQIDEENLRERGVSMIDDTEHELYHCKCFTQNIK